MSESDVPRTPLRQNWSNAMRRMSSWSNSRGRMFHSEKYLTLRQECVFITVSKTNGAVGAFRQRGEASVRKPPCLAFTSSTFEEAHDAANSHLAARRKAGCLPPGNLRQSLPRDARSARGAPG